MDKDGVLKHTLPDCFAVVHPRLPSDRPYPNINLCGAGVAFKLAWGIGLAMSGANRVNDEFRAFLMEATALAALGTIADVVPLVGENRVLAHFGLSALKQSKLTGIQALIRSAGLDRAEARQLSRRLSARAAIERLRPNGPRAACRRDAHNGNAAKGPARSRSIWSSRTARARRSRRRSSMKRSRRRPSLKYDSDDCRGIVLACRRTGIRA